MINRCSSFNAVNELKTVDHIEQYTPGGEQRRGCQHPKANGFVLVIAHGIYASIDVGISAALQYV